MEFYSCRTWFCCPRWVRITNITFSLACWSFVNHRGIYDRLLIKEFIVCLSNSNSGSPRMEWNAFILGNTPKESICWFVLKNQFFVSFDEFCMDFWDSKTLLIFPNDDSVFIFFWIRTYLFIHLQFDNLIHNPGRTYFAIAFLNFNFGQLQMCVCQDKIHFISEWKVFNAQ